MGEIRIRSYRQQDAAHVIAIYRDACESLRKSKGGQQSDHTVDALITQSDREILHDLTTNSILLIAEVDGDSAGIGVLTRTLPLRLCNSAYSKAHYVLRKYQGKGVGSRLRHATLDLARQLGCRKVYGFSTPEAVEFHKRFGARFIPRLDTVDPKSGMKLQYYEFALKQSILNEVRFEPLFFTLGKLRRKAWA